MNNCAQDNSIHNLFTYFNNSKPIKDITNLFQWRRGSEGRGSTGPGQGPGVLVVAVVGLVVIAWGRFVVDLVLENEASEGSR